MWGTTSVNTGDVSCRGGRGLTWVTQEPELGPPLFVNACAYLVCTELAPAVCQALCLISSPELG